MRLRYTGFMERLFKECIITYLAENKSRKEGIRQAALEARTAEHVPFLVDAKFYSIGNFISIATPKVIV